MKTYLKGSHVTYEVFFAQAFLCTLANFFWWNTLVHIFYSAVECFYHITLTAQYAIRPNSWQRLAKMTNPNWNIQSLSGKKTDSAGTFSHNFLCVCCFISLNNQIRNAHDFKTTHGPHLIQEFKEIFIKYGLESRYPCANSTCLPSIWWISDMLDAPSLYIQVPWYSMYIIVKQIYPISTVYT